MGCSCIPPPASLQPRKVYNILVPDVFPLKAPELGHAVTAGVEKRIEKIGDYIQKNPARIAKVSRRLTRRIKHALIAKQYGYVEIAVHAYRRLLEQSCKDETTYSFTYFAKELVQQPDTVISTLVTHPDLALKRLGAQLLASYINAQDEVDNQRDAIRPLVTLVCNLAKAHSSASTDNADPANSPKSKLLASCLSALSAYVALCNKLKVLPEHLDEIEEVVLGSLDHSSEHHEEDSAKAAALTTSDHPADLSRALLHQFRPMLQDVGTLHRVMGTLLRYLDQGSKWQQGTLVERLMASVAHACADQPFPLFTALLRHAATSGLPTSDRIIIVRLAMKQSIPYSLSAFGIALQELPKALANAHESITSTSTTSNNNNNNGSSSSHNPAVLQELHEAAYAAVLRLARDVGNASQLCEAIGTTLRSHPNESKTAIALLGCARHSLGVVPELADNNRRFAGRVFPPPYLTTLTQILATWSADARVHAAAMLAATLPCCGPSLQDDKQAATLLSTAQALACGDKPGLPKDVTVLDAVAISCIGSKRPEALLNGVRLVLDVQQSALRWAAGVEVGVSSVSNQWGAALLMLTNSLLHCLAESGQCATLQTLQFTVGPAAVGGSITSLMGGLMAAKVSFADSTEAETAAATCLQRAAAQSSETGWSGRVVDAVCSGGLLAQHYGTSLRGLLSEPLRYKPTASAREPRQSARGNGPAERSQSLQQPGAVSPAVIELTNRMMELARVDRTSSTRRERLNLHNALDLLGDNTGAAQTPGPPAPPATAPSSSADVAASVDDVLAMLLSPAPAKPAAGGALSMAELARRLEQTIC